MLHVDGDFKSNKGNCKHHCSPSCHPEQIGPEWVYGCTHNAWPQIRNGDFCPIVECAGEMDKCELKGRPFIGRYKGGLKRRISNATKKVDKNNALLAEIESLTGKQRLK